ncbi:hypothetical protein N781_06345 [Pontibacillus halophilus JSM 076056 = DSM 19796]|uniref:Uncharacterized protein n=1 Tax=Pontibacillus halophilus JSM 076056 = DSM 19796 TaxID=1385510 RepID=A0A0A5I4K0_9BACI|nr:hypothetical protein [Pontibacillus halophilus]KGX90752.1 hypothetical protein N781_06345 [Pontibacillus halophilus JSM 076056 = DSM 19796]
MKLQRRTVVTIVACAFILTLLTPLLDGTEVKSAEGYQLYQQRASQGEVRLGYPFGYIEMGPTRLTPPYPYRIGFEYEAARSVDIFVLLINVAVYSLLFSIATSIGQRLVQRFSTQER